MDFLEKAKKLAEAALKLHSGEQTTWFVGPGDQLQRTKSINPKIAGLHVFVACGDGININASENEMKDPGFKEKADRIVRATEQEYEGVKNPYLVKRTIVVVCETLGGEVLRSATGMYDVEKDGLKERMFRESEVRS